MNQRRIITLLIIIIGVLIIYNYMKPVESFATPSDVYSEQITGFMTTTADLLCPTYTFILTEKAKEKKGSDAEMKRAAEQTMIEEAGGSLFPCPPPNDPLAVPADIDARIQTTVQYLSKMLDTLLKQIQSALNCESQDAPVEGFSANLQQYAETFQDVCSADQLALNKQTAEQAAIQAASKSCIAPQNLTPQQRTQILQARADTLSRLLTQKSVAQQLMKIKQSSEEVQSLKRRMEVGELIPNCPT